MSQRETISVKQVQLVLITYGQSTCNNGAAITHNVLCLSLAWQSGGGEWDSVIWWITDKSLGNHGRLTTLKPFIDFSMLPFSDERDIFNGLWLLLSEDHSLLVDGGFEGHCWWKKDLHFDHHLTSTWYSLYLLWSVSLVFLYLCVD